MANEHHHSEHHDEAAPVRGVDRRDFLKLAGFSFAGLLASGCQPAKMEKAIPYLIKPEEITPGVANWYATTCAGCSAGCGVLAKTRDGRPIKLEGNPEHPLSLGGICCVGQADLMMLYDTQRPSAPMIRGQQTTWDELDKQVGAALDRIRRSSGAVRVLTGTLTSPTTRALVNKFVSQFDDAKHVEYDAISSSAILDAHQKTHGVRVLPHYRFDRAEVIASFDADFLDTWISPVEFTRAYTLGRTVGNQAAKFSRHVQFESRLSVTGGKADERYRLSPDELRAAVQHLALMVATKAGTPDLTISPSPVAETRRLQRLADELWTARGKGLVVCGLNDRSTQVIVNFINATLGNYGNAVDINAPSLQKNGNDAELESLIAEVCSGKVSVLIVQGTNPVYDLPHGDVFKDALKNVPLVIVAGSSLNETAVASTMFCAEPHSLESWNDTGALTDIVSLMQPTIQPFGNTRSFGESLSAWMGEKRSARELIAAHWESAVYPLRQEPISFQAFWDSTVERGFSRIQSKNERAGVFNKNSLEQVRSIPASAGMTLVIYPTMALYDGRNAHNPWLQEMPNPISKIVWDNYASLSPMKATELGLTGGDIARFASGGFEIELPLQIQPGQHDSVVAIALGYGRIGTDRFTNIGPQWFEAKPTVTPGGLVGKNVAPFLWFRDGAMSYDHPGVTITKSGTAYTLAATQRQNTLVEPHYMAIQGDEPREIVQETTLAAYRVNAGAGSFVKREDASLWPDAHRHPGHHWGMTIDLNACTGCSACIVSCMVENNIPLVGKDEVERNRDMAWIRVDRYYEENEDGNLAVAYQPMMCQHCGNAPCETVCPVLATVHSEEGLNQQVYNRCVGTRYCSNNCPYKVRHFNWFDYDRGDERERLALNPDVVVRERGVMEKCSLCVQRIQAGKNAAVNNGTPYKDGDIRTACEQSCPAQAIVFGDMNEQGSRVSDLMNDPRYYRVLDELGVKPSIGYLTLIRNREEAAHAKDATDG